MSTPWLPREDLAHEIGATGGREIARAVRQDLVCRGWSIERREVTPDDKVSRGTRFVYRAISHSAENAGPDKTRRTTPDGWMSFETLTEHLTQDGVPRLFIEKRRAQARDIEQLTLPSDTAFVFRIAEDDDILDAVREPIATDGNEPDDVSLSREEFGRRLRFQRTRAGLSQIELADALGYAQAATISAIENGRTSISRKKRALAHRMFPELLSANIDPWHALGIEREVYETLQALDDLAFGQKLRAARKAAGMTQEELAERLGYSRGALISRIETGKAPASKSKRSTALKVFPDLLADDLGRRLRFQRLKAKMTQDELAEALGYARGVSVSMLEHGRISISGVKLKTALELFPDLLSADTEPEDTFGLSSELLYELKSLDDEAFGQKLRRARRAAGLEQPELARELGYSRGSTVSSMECGKYTVPLAKRVAALKLFPRLLDPHDDVDSALPEPVKIDDEQASEIASLPGHSQLRDVRRAKELSTEEIAASLGVAPSTVYFWETGRSVPRPRHYEAYFALLGVQPPFSVERLQAVMTAMGLNKATLADELGLSKTTVMRWFHHGQIPRGSHYVNVVRFIETHAHWIATSTPSGSALRRARLHHGFTRLELASAMGVDAQSIRRWEHGKVPIPAMYSESLRSALPTLADFEAGLTPEAVRLGRLEAVRLHAGLSQEELAELAGVSVDQVARWERAALASPKEARRVADVLNTSVFELEGEFGQPGFADFFRRGREAAGLTLHDISEQLFVRLETVEGWASGVVPRQSHYLSLAQLFNIDPPYSPERLRQARAEADLTYDELAHRLDVDPTTIRRWERGETYVSRKHDEVVSFINDDSHVG